MKTQIFFFAWGSMMFTAGLAADILFYSFSEWILYATDPHIAELGSIQDWSSVYPIFSLELNSVGVLSCVSGSFWFYASCQKKRKTEIFRSVSSNSGGNIRMVWADVSLICWQCLH